MTPPRRHPQNATLSPLCTPASASRAARALRCTNGSGNANEFGPRALVDHTYTSDVIITPERVLDSCVPQLLDGPFTTT